MNLETAMCLLIALSPRCSAVDFIVDRMLPFFAAMMAFRILNWIFP